MDAKIIFGHKPDKNKILGLKRHIYLEDIEKALLEGYLGLTAESINYRDFLKFKAKNEEFYLEVKKFGE